LGNGYNENEFSILNSFNWILIFYL
jgi:hypothetical protein